jgi:hypothetical protein
MTQSLLSADSLLRCKLRTLDGAVAGLTDLILDTEAAGPWPIWSCGCPRSGAARADPTPFRCLVALAGIDWLDADAGILHLSVGIGALRDAPARPLRISDGTGDGIPVIDVAS